MLHVEILTLQGLQKSHPARAPAYSAFNAISFAQSFEPQSTLASAQLRCLLARRGIESNVQDTD